LKLNIAKFELLQAKNSLTQTKLAELSGISRQNISTIIRRGTCLPCTAAKLAKALNVDVEEILVKEG